MRNVTTSIKCVLVVAGFCTTQSSVALEAPEGRVILTVTGNISETNGAEGARFDRDMLLALGTETWQTETPWTEGENTFKGPKLSALLEAVGADGKQLKATALNDYSAHIPVQDAYDHGVMLAMDMDGKPMSVREKGPIFVLYPFMKDPALNNEVIHNRSVWQVKSITVE